MTKEQKTAESYLKEQEHSIIWIWEIKPTDNHKRDQQADAIRKPRPHKKPQYRMIPLGGIRYPRSKDLYETLKGSGYWGIVLYNLPSTSKDAQKLLVEKQNRKQFASFQQS